MDDGLVSLLTLLSQKRLNREEIGKKISGRQIDFSILAGEIAKYHLRLTVEEFIRSTAAHHKDPWAQHFTLEHRRYTFKDDGRQVLVYGNNSGNVITTFDTPLEINSRPIIVDIRGTQWRKVREHYFAKHFWDRTAVLDDTFGCNNYDRVLVVARDQDRREERDNVRIAKMPYTRAQFLQQAEAVAREYSALKSNNGKR